MSVSSTVPVNDGHRKALAWIGSGPGKLLIGGQWVDARSSKSFETIDPATEAVLARIAEGEQADVDAAVAAARKAFEAPSWSGISPYLRAR